jgi:hypothetical protein
LATMTNTTKVATRFPIVSHTMLHVGYDNSK